MENVTDVRNYNVEVEVIEETTTIIEELMTPTFIALAASVAAATVIVIMLIGLLHQLVEEDRKTVHIFLIQG